MVIAFATVGHVFPAGCDIDGGDNMDEGQVMIFDDVDEFLKVIAKLQNLYLKSEEN